MTISPYPDFSPAARLWELPAADRPQDAAFALRSALRVRLGGGLCGGFGGGIESQAPAAAPLALDCVGMPVMAPLDPAAMAASRPREIARLRLITGDAQAFDDAVLPAVFGWAAYAQGLPASPVLSGGAGSYAELFGLFDCGLLTAAVAAERLDQKLLAGTRPVRERRALADAMRLAAILAGILHAARVLGRLQISAGQASGGAFVREGLWRPEISTLRQFALEAALRSKGKTLFSLAWRSADGRSEFSALSAFSILHALLTPAAKARLTTVPAVWAALEAVVSGEAGDPGAPEGTAPMLAALLGETVMRAASRAAFDRARATMARDGGPSPGAAAWGEAFDYAFKALIGRRVWTINEPPFFPEAKDVKEAGEDNAAPESYSADAAISLAWGLDGMFLPWPSGVLAASAFAREAFAMTGCPTDPHETAMILAAAGLVAASPEGTPFWRVRLPMKRVVNGSPAALAESECVSVEALRLADPMRWASLHAAARRRAGESRAYASEDPAQKRAAVRPMNLRLSDWPILNDLAAETANSASSSSSLGSLLAALPAAARLEVAPQSAEDAEAQGDFPSAVAELKERLLAVAVEPEQSDLLQTAASGNASPKPPTNAPQKAPTNGSTKSPESAASPKAPRRRPGNLRGRSFFVFRLRPPAAGAAVDAKALSRLSQAISALSMREDAGDFVLPEGLVVPVDLLSGGDLALDAQHWHAAGLLALPKVIEKKFWAIASRQCAQVKRVRAISGKPGKASKRNLPPSARERVEAFVLARRPAIDIVPEAALSAAFEKLVARTDRAAAPINESLRMADQVMADALESDLRPMLREGVLVAKGALEVQKRWENGDASPCGWPAPGRYAAFAEGILAERIAALSRRIWAERQAAKAAASEKALSRAAPQSTEASEASEAPEKAEAPETPNPAANTAQCVPEGAAEAVSDAARATASEAPSESITEASTAPTSAKPPSAVGEPMDDTEDDPENDPEDADEDFDAIDEAAMLGLSGEAEDDEFEAADEDEEDNPDDQDAQEMEEEAREP